MLLWYVNGAGVAAIALIVWWFWLSKPRMAHAAGTEPINIVVADGVYMPARIEVPAEKPIRLRFLRKDPNPCAEKVIFADLNVSEDLTVGEPKDVTVTLPKAGEYAFTCQMQMYRGTLVARAP